MGEVELGRSSKAEVASVEYLEEVMAAHYCGWAAVELLLAERYGLLAASLEAKVAEQ